MTGPEGPHTSLYNRGTRRIRRGCPKSTALNAVDFAVADSWTPRPWRPERTRSNCSGAVTEAVQGHLLMLDDHTPSPGAPYAKPGLH